MSIIFGDVPSGAKVFLVIPQNISYPEYYYLYRSFNERDGFTRKLDKKIRPINRTNSDNLELLGFVMQ